MAARIRAARAASRITNADLARSCDVHEKTVQRWQTGRYEIPSSCIVKLAAALEVDPTWLLVGDPAEGVA
jgi:transcriptional regulator with XRE-family HTH domain